MTLILSNEDIAPLLSMDECMERLEEMYADLGERRAVNRPRSDVYGPIQDSGRYVFKSMDGVFPRHEVAALRLNSDVIAWNRTEHGVRKDKSPMANGKWVGLVLLFSTRTGEPLAIMPDGVMQRLRVAATNGIAAKFMAPRAGAVYALLGAGWQAGSQALAIAAARPLDEIRIYSPTQANRERLAGELAESLGVRVKAVASAEAAVRGADIVGMATNSVTPVVEREWLEPHAHVTCVKQLELGDGILEAADQIVVHTRLDKPANYIVGEGENPILAHDPEQGINAEARQGRAGNRASSFDLTRMPDLGELVVGQVPDGAPGRPSVFVNTVGMGIQFAAIASIVYEKAKAGGIGNTVPTDWFLETVHP